MAYFMTFISLVFLHRSTKYTSCIALENVNSYSRCCKYWSVRFSAVLKVFHWLDLTVYIDYFLPVSRYSDGCFLREVIEHPFVTINICNT